MKIYCYLCKDFYYVEFARNFIRCKNCTRLIADKDNILIRDINKVNVYYQDLKSYEDFEIGNS